MVIKTQLAFLKEYKVNTTSYNYIGLGIAWSRDGPACNCKIAKFGLTLVMLKEINWILVIFLSFKNIANIFLPASSIMTRSFKKN